MNPDELRKLADDLEKSATPLELEGRLWAALDCKGKPQPITQSIDAAIRLIPETFSWLVEDMKTFRIGPGAAYIYPPGKTGQQGHGTTPAAALCVSLLRVLATEEVSQ